MKDIEYILDFAMNLGSDMLEAGSNLERANDTMNRICLSYGLSEISIFSLNSIIQISAKSDEDDYTLRQIAVPSMDIHLERLSRLNQLSRRVCAETPAPCLLMDLLASAKEIKEYKTWEILLARLFAMGGMCVLFGGTLGDIIAADLIIACMFWLIRMLSYSNINNVIRNTMCMLFAGIAAHGLVFIGLGQQYSVISITCAMMLLPGIPLVNAARNFLCGNEMNGILESIKALIETLAIVLGLGISMYLFGGTV